MPAGPEFPGPSASGGSLVVGGLFAGSRGAEALWGAGWRGLEKARQELGVQTRFLDGMAPRKELLVPALTQLAEQGAQLVIAHGGQNNQAAAEVAARFPRTQFVVTQGMTRGVILCNWRRQLEVGLSWPACPAAAYKASSRYWPCCPGVRRCPGPQGAMCLCGRCARYRPQGQAADELLGAIRTTTRNAPHCARPRWLPVPM